MNVQYFIGIVPPVEYMKLIEQFQRKWMNKLGVEPHITLKAQGGLTSNKAWLPKVQRICADLKPFRISIGEPKDFGENILYLSVNSAALHDLHQKIVQAIAPSEDLIKQYFELDAYVPHLTLGKEQYGRNISTGLSKKEIKDMAQLANVELAPFPEFEVNFIRIYALNIEKHQYEKYVDIPLKH